MGDTDTTRSARPRRRHFVAWAPADWLGSSLRGELALAGDHVARLLYRELLDVLYDRGGYVPRGEIPGACMIPRAEAEPALERLIASGRIVETPEGVTNPRVLATLGEAAAWRQQQAERGRVGAERRWRPHRDPMATDGPPSPSPSPSPTPTPSRARARADRSRSGKGEPTGPPVLAVAPVVLELDPGEKHRRLQQAVGIPIPRGPKMLGILEELGVDQVDAVADRIREHITTKGSVPDIVALANCLLAQQRRRRARAR